MNYRMILNIIGKIICVEAVFMMPALLISAAHGESAAVTGFAVTIIISAIMGLPCLLHSPKRRDFFAREGFATVGMTWIAVSLLGALPFLISGAIPNYIDCLFETVSGFTTTGASILNDVESLPMGLVYWRSFTHWLGGMGVLVFVLALAPLTAKDGGESMHLLRAESPGINISKLVPRMRRSASILYAIYIVMTVVMIIMLLLGGVKLFDSVTLTFGTAGTGGFAIRNDSIASYSAYAQWVITAFMILFGINFNIFFMVLLREFRKILKNEELRLYLVIIAVSVLIISLDTAGYFASAGETFRTAAFQVASIISTTGYCSTDFDLWPQLSRTILILLMFVGGCAGSTGGGLKVIRIAVIYKAARRSLYRIFHPNSVKLIYMDGERLDDDTVNSVTEYLTVYILLYALGTLLISVDGFSFESNFTAVASCINNIGPGFGAVGATMNYSGFSWFSKVILSIMMLIGRLEIYPVMFLFVPTMWKK